MAWTTTGNLKGPSGAQGPTGAAGATGAQGVTGATGAPGQSVTIRGTVANAAALPVASGANFDWGYITADTGHLWVNDSGTAWLDVGNITGPAGPTGSQGTAGSTGPTGPQGTAGTAGATGPTGSQGVRGASWYTGSGAPGTITGSAPGDHYLDVVSGTTYDLT